MARKRLGEILVQAGVIDEARLRAALVEQRRWGGHLGRILVDMKVVSEDTLVRALSHQLNFPIVNLERRSIDQDVLELVPGELAERHSMIPFHREGKFLDVAMSDPTNLGIIDELRIRTQLNVRPYLAGPMAIEKALARYYGRGMGMLSGVGNPMAPENAQSGAEFPQSVDVIDFDSRQHGTGPNRVGDPVTSAHRRAQAMAMAQPSKGEVDAELRSMQDRIATLEALVQRDEDVIRKLLGLLIDKGVATREEILDRIK